MPSGRQHGCGKGGSCGGSGLICRARGRWCAGPCHMGPARAGTTSHRPGNRDAGRSGGGAGGFCGAQDATSVALPPEEPHPCGNHVVRRPAGAGQVVTGRQAGRECPGRAGLSDHNADPDVPHPHVFRNAHRAATTLRESRIHRGNFRIAKPASDHSCPRGVRGTGEDLRQRRPQYAASRPRRIQQTSAKPSPAWRILTRSVLV